MRTDGTVEINPIFPIVGRLNFRPHPDVASMFPSEGEYDSSGERIPFWDQLKTIPEGTVVFQVFMNEELLPEPIANIRTTSSMETCSFGD